MGQIGFNELLVIFLIVFLLFGAKRLPELGESLGKAIRSFNRGMRDVAKDKTDDESKPS